MNEYFEFLEDLRDSGIMNMMGAPRELQHEFGLDRAEAREVFQKWCDSLAESQPTLPAQRSAAISQKKAPPFFGAPPTEGVSCKINVCFSDFVLKNY